MGRRARRPGSFFSCEQGVFRLHRLLDVGIWLSAGLLFMMFYPGGMSIDSYTQLAEARVGDFGDWHPPFMAWLWRGAETIRPGPLPMLLAQFGLFLGGLWLFARPAFAGRKTALRVFVLLTLWVMPISGIVGVIWKDVWTSCLLLAGAALVWSFAQAERAAVRWTALLLAAVAMLGALLFRHNAVFAVVPLLVFAGWQQERPLLRRAVAALAIGLLGSAILMVAAGALNRALTNKREFPVQSILIYDLAGVAVRTGRTDLLQVAADQIPDVLRGQPGVSIEALRSHYYPSTWTPLAFVEGSPLAVTASAAQVQALTALWRRAVLEEPRAYLRHRAAVFAQVIGAYRGPLFAPLYFGVPADSPDHAEISRRFRLDAGQLSPVQQRLREAFASAAKRTLYRPWVWLILNVVAVIVAALFSSRRAALIALGSSGLCYELALFFIAPSADYRYSHWLVLSTWAVLAALAWEFAARRFGAGRFRKDCETPAG